MHKKVVVALMAAAGLFSATAAQAEGPFMVRARAVYLDWGNKNSDGLQNVAGKIEAENRWIPEVDFSYFFTKNIAAELVLTYPQQVDIKAGGTKIGHVDALPPSLVLQYHFTDLGAFKPYIGAGVNYTAFTKNGFNALGTRITVDSSTYGLVGQVGADYMLDKNWSINVDAKYIQMETDVKAGGAKIGKLGLNPVTWGVGLGYRF